MPVAADSLPTTVRPAWPARRPSAFIQFAQCSLLAPLILVAWAALGCANSVFVDPAGGSAELPDVPDRGPDNALIAQILERNSARENDAAKRDSAIAQATAYYRLALEAEPGNATWHQRYQALIERLARRNADFTARLKAEYAHWYRDHSGDAMFASLYARALISSGRNAEINEAQRIIGEALANAPDDYWLNLRMGVIAMARYDLPLALKQLDCACQQGPGLKQFEASRLYGQLCVQLEKFELAAEPLRQVLENDPTATLVEYEITAIALMRLGRLGDAETILQHDLPPELAADGNGHHLKLVGEVMQRGRKWSAAAQAYRSYLTLNPAAPDRAEVEWRIRDVDATSREPRE